MPSNWNIKELKWEAMDFDGTIVFTKEEDDYSLDNALPNYELLHVMRKAQEAGKRFIIYTSRHWDDYPIIEKWLKRHKVPFKFIICGKILVEHYIDDRGLSPQQFIDLWKDKDQQ